MYPYIDRYTLQRDYEARIEDGLRRHRLEIEAACLWKSQGLPTPLRARWTAFCLRWAARRKQFVHRLRPAEEGYVA